MTMTETTSQQSTRRAPNRPRYRRRSWATLLSLAIGTLMIGAGVVTVASIQNARESSTVAAPFPSFAPPAQEKERRALSAAEPLRLWIAGDSLAGTLGPSLGNEVADTGVVQPQYDSRPSSGLSSPTFFNWPKYATEQLAALNPEVVVFIMGTNDGGIVTRGNDAWATDYRAKVASMMDLLAENNREVYWIGAPIMRDQKASTRVREINKIFVDEADQRPGVTYVDAYKLFSNENGGYAKVLADQSGKNVTVRADDGIHFSNAGGARLASVVFQLLDATWQLVLQADPENAKKVIQTKGSGRTPGSSSSGSRSSGSRSGSSGGSATSTTVASSNTTAPAGEETGSTTAAPPTSSSPPTTSGFSPTTTPNS